MKIDLPNETTVSAFLDENPAFLKSYLAKQFKPFAGENSNGTIYRDESELGKNIIDVTGKIADRAREEARILAQRNLSLIDVAEDNTEKWQRLLTVATGFIAVRNLNQFSEMLDEKLPVIFKLAGARLIMPKEIAIEGADEAGFLLLPSKQIRELQGAKSVYLGPPPKSGLALFSTPIASIALVSLPNNLPDAVAKSVLFLAGRSKNSFKPDQGDTILSNLSQIIGTCLEAILKEEKDIINGSSRN